MAIQLEGQREKLKQALKGLHEASLKDLEAAKKEAAKYFKVADPKELALAEQELIQEGASASEIKRLCDVHLELMREQLGLQAKKIKLPSWHPISISMDEHKIIKRNLKRLKATFDKLKTFSSLKKASRHINILKELSHFFLETEKHYKREEDALFPRLEAHGITEPPQIFKEDHAEFLEKKKRFYDSMTGEQRDLKDLIAAIEPVVDFLTKNLEEHIYKEDNILYPLALKTLEEGEWRQVRKKFDTIGYCCFAPADIKRK